MRVLGKKPALVNLLHTKSTHSISTIFLSRVFRVLITDDFTFGGLDLKETERQKIMGA